jgi:hypothetical protein
MKEATRSLDREDCMRIALLQTPALLKVRLKCYGRGREEEKDVVCFVVDSINSGLEVVSRIAVGVVGEDRETLAGR